MIAAVAQETVPELVAKAQAAYAAQDMATACAAVDAAIAQMPDSPALAFMQAQFHWEGWFEATPLFERAALLNPGRRDVVRNAALALASEGQGERAMRLLDGILARNPAWIEGHDTLATLRTTAGGDDPLRSFAEAVTREPGNAALKQAWFHKLAAAKDWEGARKVLALGEMPLLGLWLDCESGAAGSDPAIFADYQRSNDPGLVLLQVRHALRHGDPARALLLAEGQLGTPHAGQFWPYVNLCWRLTGDERADWLERDFARAIDLDLPQAMLADLAVFLRGLHRMAAPYPEQSVRGGTQTERNLLLHHDPLIGQLRSKITEAVRGWRDGLPDDPVHPLLSRKPDAIRFSGSWSVRLAGGGHHSAHTHPHGWASSALYIVVPPETGRDHAGELALGMPPPELGLGLEPTQYITPRPGHLVLFPSTTWHGTVPFEGEERLTVAFDVAPATTRSTR
ncbi:putative 2OG-Fe(II) oxygenase [Erythrobacter sp. SDW2]|uniref:putative 2OG-Fe(II) oxygenase n=1 Tax=Erythrobacter sp. SDW2 TaxID=2907154 RepID=UPI001F228BB3|nr:putative 2OG-Fe(II) oxygenase [Erythrobacter sp. SDW2]UIP06457.1 putative 2OG-Fe(II) oxygenase [Erythrobacter sp. SDW2]